MNPQQNKSTWDKIVSVFTFGCADEPGNGEDPENHL